MTIAMHRFRFPWVVLFGAAVAVTLFAFPVVGDALEFDRVAIARGEFWRLLTCHFVHWTRDHLIWDVLAFAGFGAVVEGSSRRRLVVTVIAAAVAIGLAMELLMPALLRYRGLSGVDSALFVAAILTLLRRARALRSPLAMVLLVGALLGFGFKTAYEFVTGNGLLVGANPGFVVVPLAHVVGAVVGMLSFGVVPWRHRPRPPGNAERRRLETQPGAAPCPAGDPGPNAPDHRMNPNQNS